MNTNINERILNKIIDNINFCEKKGMVIASPSNDPPYKFHWIRDVSVVMRAIIESYKNNKDPKYFNLIINYLENEFYVQNLNTICGLGEPKVNINGTPFNDPWGRPQNDGPALRGILLFEIYDLLEKDYPNILSNIVVPMINKDIKYIIENLNKTSFDLWEEIKGWHFYTRFVQLKFLKDYISHGKNNSNFNKKIDNIYLNFKNNIKDHICNNYLISSFNEYGHIVRVNDASLLLAYCHVRFDKELLEEFPLELIKINAYNLINDFRNKYNKNFNMIGRYKNDKYYNGHLWPLCSLGLAQCFYKLSKVDIANQIFEYVLNIDSNLDIAEQYDPINKIQLSAKKLTWNYVELYMSYLLFRKN